MVFGMILALLFVFFIFFLFCYAIFRIFYGFALNYYISWKCSKYKVNSYAPIKNDKSNIKFWYNKSFYNYQYVYNLSPFKKNLWIVSIIKNKSFNRYLSIDQFNVIVVLASYHLVTINKKFSTKELNHIDEFFSQFLTKNKKNDLIWLLGLYKKNNINLRPNLQGNETLRSLIKGINVYFTPQHKYTLLYYLFELAESDNDIENLELNFIFGLGQKIGLSKKELNSITSLYFSTYIPYPETEFSKGKKKKTKEKQSRTRSKSKYVSQSKLENSLSIFNLKKTATNDEIKKAYKKMVKLHHPDRVAHLGEEHVLKATELFKRINVAYEYLEDARGI